ncbi:MAG: RNA polymerase sigma-70 factor [Dysgonamonadaceae bacterium]|jgi:RNA polymerase sigma-70 factor (ECF subfamily)|nr:RNA polymerase sigma-70 factor [Dysgonamonadaceae bacterium]
MKLDNFRELYNLYYESLCKYLNFYTKDVHIIDDVVQDVFLHLWEARDMLEIQHIKTYLFHTARNKMLNYIRDEENRSYLLEKWFEKQLENARMEKEAFETEQLLAAVKKAVETLPSQCREIFLLSKMEDMTYKQIAELKQLSIKTVENQVGIALKKIRKFLSENYLQLYPILSAILFP